MRKNFPIPLRTELNKEKQQLRLINHICRHEENPKKGKFA